MSPAPKVRKYDPEEIERFLDVRVRSRYVTEGTITNKQVEKHLSELPDSADLADYVNLPVLGATEEEEARAALAARKATR